MMKNPKKWYYSLSVLGAFLLLFAGMYLFSGSLKEYYVPVYPWMLAGVALLNMASQHLLFVVAEKHIKKFTQVYMAVMGSKMIIYLIFLAIFIYNCQENRVAGLLVFGTLYLIYSFLEVFSIVWYLRQRK